MSANVRPIDVAWREEWAHDDLIFGWIMSALGVVAFVAGVSVSSGWACVLEFALALRMAFMARTCFRSRRKLLREAGNIRRAYAQERAS